MAGTQTEDRRGNPENLVPQFSNLAHALAGIDLPQDKEGLLSRARKNGAEREMITLIENLPEQDYATMADVIAAAADSGAFSKEEE